MLFNSIDFAVFLPIVFVLYWFVVSKSLSMQNILILISSYVFYSWWDYRFLFLLIFSTTVDFVAGIKIANSSNSHARRLWLIVTIFVNLGLLVVLKYYNFFIDSFSTLFQNNAGFSDSWTLNIILPVGISFYTFHGLSYVIDIYRGRIQPTKDFVDYSVFVSFFPLLVAGPIERATHLLPQLQKVRKFNYDEALDGCKQILWGLFKKVVIADSCAVFVNDIFDNSSVYSGSTLMVGAVLFAVQIYGDFSGYSDIALGVAKLFGIRLLRNFAYPYFSRDIAEFWRRWHISLSSWFKDYLYIPLGGSKGGTLKKLRNTFVIFLVSGLWHGANWTFIFWGLLNAVYFVPLLLSNRNRSNLEIVAQGRLFPSWSEAVSILSTFSITVIAWIFFRAASIDDAFQYLSRIFSNSSFAIPDIFPGRLFLLIIAFFFVEWMGREDEYPIKQLVVRLPKLLRWTIYYLILALVFSHVGPKQEFIYFQF